MFKATEASSHQHQKSRQAEREMSLHKPGRRVVFVQKFVPHYRLPLFELLRSRLQDNGIDFKLVYGRPDPYEGSKINAVYPEWGARVSSWILPVAGRYLYWQWAAFHVRKGDVVIVEHASKLLDNYVLFLLEQVGFIKLCYFGHGQNFQDKHELAVARVLKRMTVRRVSGWFAYTQMSVNSLVAQGVPPEKIRSINNTLVYNTKLSEKEVVRKRSQCVYVGGLYGDKRIEFLLASGLRIRELHPDFTLHIIGNGPEAETVRNFASRHDWCVYHGHVYGESRDRLLFESTAILMPGLVGLVAVDSFHFAAPILTTNCGQHSPEVAYLEHLRNSMILENEGTVESYSAMVLAFLEDDDLSSSIRQGCREAAELYTLENTADRFVKGILEISG